MGMILGRSVSELPMLNVVDDQSPLVPSQATGLTSTSNCPHHPTFHDNTPVLILLNVPGLITAGFPGIGLVILHSSDP